MKQEYSCSIRNNIKKCTILLLFHITANKIMKANGLLGLLNGLSKLLHKIEIKSLKGIHEGWYMALFKEWSNLSRDETAQNLAVLYYLKKA